MKNYVAYNKILRCSNITLVADLCGYLDKVKCKCFSKVKPCVNNVSTEW